MFKARKLFIIIFVFVAGCTGTSKKSLNQTEILKEGAELYAKYGCAVCHSMEGKEIYGPALNNIYQKKVKVIRNGKELEVVVNRKYLKRSINDPRFEKVLEYKNKEMPISNFSDDEVEILVEYLIALQDENRAKE